MTAEDAMYQEALEAVAAKDRSRARDLLTRLLKDNALNPNYWLWMSSVVDTARERLFCLNKVLELEPGNQLAQRGLILLGVQPLDDNLMIPARLHKRRWEPQTMNEIDAQKLLKQSWKMPIYLAVGGVLVVLLLLGVLGAAFFGFGYFDNRARMNAGVILAPDVPTQTPTKFDFVFPPPGPTPLWMMLKATYTPTPIYANTPHPRADAYRSVMRFYQKEDYENALNMLDQVIDLEPDSPDLYYLQGELRRFRKDYQGALDSYNAALGKKQDFAPAYLGRAKVRLDMGSKHQDEIQADLEKAIENDPNMGEAYLVLAQVLIKLGDFEAAQAQLNEAERFIPGSPQVYLVQAGLYLEQNQVDLAVQSAEKARELDVTMLPVYSMLGKVYMRAGRFDEAETMLHVYLIYKEEDADVLTTYGLIFSAQNQPEEALKYFDQAIAADSQALEPLIQRGWILLQQEKSDEAFNSFTKAQKISPDSFEAALGSGRSLVGLDYASDAVGMFNRAQKLAKTDQQLAQVYYYRAKTYESLNNIKLSTQDYQALLDLPEEVYAPDWADEVKGKLEGLIATRTATAKPSKTPLPTETRQPTRTPLPTSTRWPTPTPTPTPTVGSTSS
jgi:tetratricopeptide (TPR) repeat protein